VLRPVTSPFSQFPITLLEIEDQLAFQVFHVVDFGSNFVEFGAQQVLDLPASMSTTVSQIEKLLDFLQGEPESLHLLDKSESCYVIRCVKAEVPLGSGCSWQQRPALVEADRIYAKFRLLCGFTNLDCAAGPFQKVWHKKIIHSRAYSRVKSTVAAFANPGSEHSSGGSVGPMILNLQVFFSFGRQNSIQRKVRARVLHLGTAFILSLCIWGHLSELFDHWDNTFRTGNDIEYSTVIVALVTGAAICLAGLAALLIAALDPSRNAIPNSVFQPIVMPKAGRSGGNGLPEFPAGDPGSPRTAWKCRRTHPLRSEL